MRFVVVAAAAAASDDCTCGGFRACCCCCCGFQLYWLMTVPPVDPEAAPINPGMLDSTDMTDKEEEI
jgi:hypothetical protein